MKAGFKFLNSNFERLDIMVNCAGIVGPSNMTCEDIPTSDFDKVYEGATYKVICTQVSRCYKIISPHVVNQ